MTKVLKCGAVRMWGEMKRKEEFERKLIDNELPSSQS